MPNIELEYWFIDDSSSDNTINELRKLQQKDPAHVHYASFSRNFGKKAGLYCGLQQATGDYVAVMDVDLQDPPELLPQMLGYLKSDKYDVLEHAGAIARTTDSIISCPHVLQVDQ